MGFFSKIIKGAKHGFSKIGKGLAHQGHHALKKMAKIVHANYLVRHANDIKQVIGKVIKTVCGASDAIRNTAGSVGSGIATASGLGLIAAEGALATTAAPIAAATAAAAGATGKVCKLGLNDIGHKWSQSKKRPRE